jgi:hypothetical protein
MRRFQSALRRLLRWRGRCRMVSPGFSPQPRNLGGSDLHASKVREPPPCPTPQQTRAGTVEPEVAGFRGRNCDNVVRTYTGGDAAKWKSTLFPCLLKTPRRATRPNARRQLKPRQPKPRPIVFRQIASPRERPSRTRGSERANSLVGWPAYPRFWLNGLRDPRPQLSSAQPCQAGRLNTTTLAPAPSSQCRAQTSISSRRRASASLRR